MSADNYEVCPRCFYRAGQEYQACLAELDSLPADDPAAPKMATLIAKAKATLRPPDEEDYRTFREEYEFYAGKDGILMVSYSGDCEICQLAFGIEEKHEIPGALT